MDKGEITITQNPANGFMSVQFKFAEDGTVWVTKHEVAELFNVYPVTIASNIAAIFKSGELFETEVMRTSKIKGCNGKFVVYYNLDVIIALSFRMKGALCRLFREWIRERIKQPIWEGRQVSILIQIGDKQDRDSAMN
jgi:Virulence protein